MSEKLRVGIIGVGGIAQSKHIPALVKHPDVEIVAICDSSEEVLEKVANREGHTHLGPLDLPESYKANAENIAERRAAEAGFRLAALLNQILK